MAKKSEALTASSAKISDYRQTISDLQDNLAQDTSERHKMEIENARLSTELAERTDKVAVLSAERDELKAQYKDALNEVYRKKGE